MPDHRVDYAQGGVCHRLNPWSTQDLRIDATSRANQGGDEPRRREAAARRRSASRASLPLAPATEADRSFHRPRSRGPVVDREHRALSDLSEPCIVAVVLPTEGRVRRRRVVLVGSDGLAGHDQHRAACAIVDSGRSDRSTTGLAARRHRDQRREGIQLSSGGSHPLNEGTRDVPTIQAPFDRTAGHTRRGLRCVGSTLLHQRNTGLRPRTNAAGSIDPAARESLQYQPCPTWAPSDAPERPGRVR